MSRECTCPDWKPNVDHINACIAMSELHSMVFELTTFRYCPWCGKKLTETNPVSLDFMSGKTEV